MHSRSEVQSRARMTTITCRFRHAKGCSQFDIGFYDAFLWLRAVVSVWVRLDQPRKKMGIYRVFVIFNYFRRIWIIPAGIDWLRPARWILHVAYRWLTFANQSSFSQGNLLIKPSRRISTEMSSDLKAEWMPFGRKQKTHLPISARLMWMSSFPVDKRQFSLKNMEMMFALSFRWALQTFRQQKSPDEKGFVFESNQKKISEL